MNHAKRSSYISYKGATQKYQNTDIIIYRFLLTQNRHNFITAIIIIIKTVPKDL